MHLRKQLQPKKYVALSPWLKIVYSKLDSIYVVVIVSLNACFVVTRCRQQLPKSLPVIYSCL